MSMVRKYCLNESMHIVEQDAENYAFIFTGTRKIRSFSVDNLVKQMINCLKSYKTKEDLLSELKQHPSEDILSCLYSLETYGIVNQKIPSEHNEKHARQLLFINEIVGSWDDAVKYQEKIENSIIVVFGVGGIGTWMVNALDQLGVGEIRICDPDVISMNNLNRQLHFTENDVGKYKVDVLKEKLFPANIVTFKNKVSLNENLEEVIKGSDFIVNSADHPSVAETSEIINSYATRHSIPYLVSGGYNMHLGMVGPIIVPGKTATFGDFLEYQKRNDPLKGLKVIKEMDQTGSLGPIAGVVANLQAMEIFKYIIGLESVNLNKFAEINFLDFSIEWRYFGPNTGSFSEV